MNQEMLCTWLGLPKSAWPPDPWTLLGLKQGDHPLAIIEERVNDRMQKLRTFQLSYPEEATEGMNRLAEAFIALTEACSKKPAPAKPAPAPKPQNGAVISKDETSVIERTKLDWRNEPPPVRKETASAPEVIAGDEPPRVRLETASMPEVIAEDAPAEESTLLSKPFVAPTKVKRQALDPALARELAEESDEATSNLGTLDAVIARVEATRKLLHAWEKVGKFLKAQSKKAPPKECEAFAKRLQAIADVMETYPAFLGHAGKPGYRVVVQARLKIPLLIVRSMTPQQREDLLGDWCDGYKVLLAHRKYLHRLFQSMRSRSGFGLFWVAVRAILNDHPRLTLAGMVVVVLLVVIGAGALAFRH
jgi:hypothetical protein